MDLLEDEPRLRLVAEDADPDPQLGLLGILGDQADVDGIPGRRPRAPADAIGE